MAVRPNEGVAEPDSSGGPHDEAAMIAHACRGDTAAFAQLVARYQHRVFGLCLRLCGNHADAEDFAQEAFVRAYGALGRFDGRAQFFTWLYRIAVNVVLSARRRTDRRPVTWTGAAPAGGDGRLAGAASHEPGPASRMEAEERAAIVGAALAALDDDQRSIITLRDMESLGYDQIAVILEIPVGTVKSRLHRARLALRDRLLPQLDAID